MPDDSHAVTSAPIEDALLLAQLRAAVAAAGTGQESGDATMALRSAAIRAISVRKARGLDVRTTLTEIGALVDAVAMPVDGAARLLLLRARLTRWIADVYLP